MLPNLPRFLLLRPQVRLILTEQKWMDGWMGWKMQPLNLFRADVWEFHFMLTTST